MCMLILRDSTSYRTSVKVEVHLNVNLNVAFYLIEEGKCIKLGKLEQNTIGGRELLQLK